MTEARRDIAVRAQQIGSPGLCIVACPRDALRVGKAALAADANHAQIIGRVDGRAVTEPQQREALSRRDESVGQERGCVSAPAAARWNVRIRSTP